MKKLLKILTISLFFLFCAFILALSIRGIPGNPTGQTINDPKWNDGPLELSPERGRFALTMSIIEDQSFHFSLPIARFTTPDLGYINEKYVSLFAPGVSFITIPGYLIGKMAGASQIGTFAIISLFALINAFLIRAIAIQLKANPMAANISAIVFLFATPAFAYAVALYQHHISTFLILSSIYILLKWKNFFSLAAIWLLFAASVPIDNPNLFLMLPIVIYASGRIIFTTNTGKYFTLNTKPVYFISFISMLFPLIFFLWFNNISNGNPFQLSGTLPTVKSITPQGKPILTNTNELKTDGKQFNPDEKKKSAIKFFSTRNLLNGFYVQFISPDRGIIVYTPVILFGILGLVLLYRKNPEIGTVFLGIIGANILLYAMWFDPWGGWAFGNRYLIPSYALLSILVAFSLTRFKKRSLLLILFFIIFAYSIIVNSLGAITSSKNPPQAEAIALERVSKVKEKYTFERNWDILNSNTAKSFIWQAHAKNKMNAVQYYYTINALLLFMGAILLINLRFNKYEN